MGRRDDEVRWSTKRVVRSNCKTEELEPGRLVRKCNKTEQIFRQTAGRPEVVESNTEYSEEDETDEMRSSTLSIERHSSSGPFSFPDLGSEMEDSPESVFSGLDDFLPTINMIRDIFGNPRIPPPFCNRRIPVGNCRLPDADNESSYGELAGEVRDDASRKGIDFKYGEVDGKVRDV